MERRLIGDAGMRPGGLDQRGVATCGDRPQGLADAALLLGHPVQGEAL
jgi:hypothetical protein